MKKSLLALLALVALTVNATHAAAPSSRGAYVLPAGVTSADYMERTVVFRVKPEYRAVCGDNAIQFEKLRLVLASEREFSVC